MVVQHIVACHLPRAPSYGGVVSRTVIGTFADHAKLPPFNYIFTMPKAIEMINQYTYFRNATYVRDMDSTDAIAVKVWGWCAVVTA